MSEHKNCSAATERETALEAAALDFIAKVDRGEARSKHSYAAFKAALGIIPAVPQTAQLPGREELVRLINVHAMCGTPYAQRAADAILTLSRPHGERGK